MKKSSRWGLSTRAVHAAERSVEGSVSFPIFQTSMFLADDEVAYDDIKYIRHNNLPNQEMLGKKFAALAGTETALPFASGMAAITASLHTYLGAGDKIIAHNTLYGGTYDYLKNELPKLGIETVFVDAGDPNSWPKQGIPNAKLFYIEALTNPLTRIPAIDAVIKYAARFNLKTFIDATFATPVNFRPAERGIDLVMHSASKYLAGHSDLVAGIIAGKQEDINRIKHTSNHLGGCLDPMACHVLTRSLKTLPLRMQRHNENGLALANFLECHDAVSRVYYPGLASHPDHQRAQEFFDGYGGMLGVEMRLTALAEGVVRSTKLFTHAGSLGGVQSLISRPAATSHLALSLDEQRVLGIAPELLRLSCGIEDAEDLITDIQQAIDLTLESKRSI